MAANRVRRSYRDVPVAALITAIYAMAPLLPGCTQPKGELKAQVGEGFSYSYPRDLSVSTKSPVEDFEIHTLTQGDGNVVLQMYVGNSPDFPTEEAGESVGESTTPSGLAARSVARARNDGLREREVLVDLSSGNDWPKYVHCWYDSLSPELAAAADAVIESVQAGPRRDSP